MPPLLLDILLFALGVVLLVGGGDSLVRGAVTLASRLGVPSFVFGLSVVAFGTSAPELALNLAAALSGNSELSFGNIVGSNIANIGLILGIAALIRPMDVHTSIVKRELPLMVMATLLLCVLAYAPPHTPESGDGFGRIDGGLLLAGFALFCWQLLRSAKAEGPAASELLGEVSTLKPEEAAQRPLGRAIFFTIFGLAALAAGGRCAELGAVGIAQALGMSNELIGLTIVAIATSLPELAASMAAAVRGQNDIAVGNIVGSNLFNILLIMGTTAMVGPVPLPPGGMSSLIAVMALSLLLLPISVTANRTVSRLEGGVPLTLYAGYIGYEVWLALGATAGV
ncbi:MAG: calcium/sodium antiporter [Phycisphaerales bacterium]